MIHKIKNVPIVLRFCNHLLEIEMQNKMWNIWNIYSKNVLYIIYFKTE